MSRSAFFIFANLWLFATSTASELEVNAANCWAAWNSGTNSFSLDGCCFEDYHCSGEETCTREDPEDPGNCGESGSCDSYACCASRTPAENYCDQLPNDDWCFIQGACTVRTQTSVVETTMQATFEPTRSPTMNPTLVPTHGPGWKTVSLTEPCYHVDGGHPQYCWNTDTWFTNVTQGSFSSMCQAFCAQIDYCIAYSRSESRGSCAFFTSTGQCPEDESTLPGPHIAYNSSQITNGTGYLSGWSCIVKDDNAGDEATDCDIGADETSSVSEILAEVVCLCEEYRSVGTHVGEGWLLEEREPLTETLQSLIRLLWEAPETSGVDQDKKFLKRWKPLLGRAYNVTHETEHNSEIDRRIWRKGCRAILVVQNDLEKWALKFD